MQQHVLRPLGIDAARYAGLRGDATDPQAECKRVLQVLRRWRDEATAAGERSSGRYAGRLIDVAVLGLGLNCHLGFNEPRKDWPCWLSADEVCGQRMAHVLTPMPTTS